MVKKWLLRVLLVTMSVFSIFCLINPKQECLTQNLGKEKVTPQSEDEVRDGDSDSGFILFTVGLN